MVKNPPANVGDIRDGGSIPGSGRSPGGGNGNPLVIKNPPANVGDIRDGGSIPGSGRSPGGGNGNPLVFLPGASHGPRSLAGYGP